MNYVNGSPKTRERIQMVKVTKEQLDLITKILTRYNNNKTKASLNFIPSKDFSQEKFLNCMIEGYEVEKTKEESILELFNAYSRQGPAHKIIRKMLDIYDMKVDGINK